MFTECKQSIRRPIIKVRRPAKCDAAQESPAHRHARTIKLCLVVVVVVIELNKIVCPHTGMTHRLACARVGCMSVRSDAIMHASRAHTNMCEVARQQQKQRQLPNERTNERTNASCCRSAAVCLPLVQPARQPVARKANKLDKEVCFCCHICAKRELKIANQDEEENHFDRLSSFVRSFIFIIYLL